MQRATAPPLTLLRSCSAECCAAAGLFHYVSWTQRLDTDGAVLPIVWRPGTWSDAVTDSSDRLVVDPATRRSLELERPLAGRVRGVSPVSCGARCCVDSERLPLLRVSYEAREVCFARLMHA